MKILIISGGTAPEYGLLKRFIDKKYEIIAADSGANVLYKYKIIPKILLGDFDSINKEVFDFFKDKTEVFRVPKEKDFTDTDLALEKALELAPDEIIFLGCTGSRLDHFLGNLCVLYRAMKNNINAYIIDENNKVMLTDKSIKVKGKKGETFSLLAFKEDVKNLFIKGAKYPLNGYNLSLTDNLTISNEFLGEEIEITFDSGVILFMRCKD